MKHVKVDISDANVKRLKTFRDLTGSDASLSEVVSRLAWIGLETQAAAVAKAMARDMACSPEKAGQEDAPLVLTVTAIEEPDDPGRWYGLVEAKRSQASMDLITHPASRFRSAEETVEVLKWFFPDALFKIEKRSGKTEKAQ